MSQPEEGVAFAIVDAKDNSFSGIVFFSRADAKKYQSEEEPDSIVAPVQIMPSSSKSHYDDHYDDDDDDQYDDSTPLPAESKDTVYVIVDKKDNTFSGIIFASRSDASDYLSYNPEMIIATVKVQPPMNHYDNYYY